jgi:hypothetical protein
VSWSVRKLPGYLSIRSQFKDAQTHPSGAFAAFAEPDYVKIVWMLRADPIGDTASIFRPETRAIATDLVARSKFRRYWSLLSPGIILFDGCRSARYGLLRNWQLAGIRCNADRTRAEISPTVKRIARRT